MKWIKKMNWIMKTIEVEQIKVKFNFSIVDYFLLLFCYLLPILFVIILFR